MLSVAIDRTSLALGVLTISDDAATGLWIPEDGIDRVARTWRRTTVASPVTHGSVQTRAVLDQSSIPLTVYAKAATTAALRTLEAEVEAALFQFYFEVAVTVDGSTQTYQCDCADVSWGTLDSGMVKGHISRATVTIPCYPVGA